MNTGILEVKSQGRKEYKNKSGILFEAASSDLGCKFASSITTGAEHIVCLNCCMNSGVKNFSGTKAHTVLNDLQKNCR